MLTNTLGVTGVPLSYIIVALLGITRLPAVSICTTKLLLTIEFDPWFTAGACPTHLIPSYTYNTPLSPVYSSPACRGLPSGLVFGNLSTAIKLHSYYNNLLITQ